MFRRKKSDAALLTKKSGEPSLPQAAKPLKPRPPQDIGSVRGGAPRPAFVPDITPRQHADIPNRTRDEERPVNRRPAADRAKTLIVGRDISLNGAVADCDKLVVEGRLEGDLTDSRVVEIAESGVLQGTAVIEEADVAGLFEGSLTVRGKLMIRPTGRVFGAIRYGELAIEGGGQIGGEIDTLAAAPGTPGAAAPGTAAISAAPGAAPGAAQGGD